MNNHKISVILPIYNLELFLVKKCVNSILSQNYNNWECILVDDGSTKEFMHKDYYKSLMTDKRFKYFYKDNEGLGPARNYGFNKSTGSLIWFIDPDDYILEKEAFNFIIDIFDKNGEIDFINFCFHSEVFNEKKCIKSGVYTNNLNFPIEYNWHTVWRNVYKRDFIQKNNIFHQDKKVKFEDVYLDLLVKTTFNKMYYTNKKLYYYNTNRNGSICKTSKNILFNLKIVVENINEAYEYVIKNNMNLTIFLYHSLYFFGSFPLVEEKMKKEMYKNIKFFNITNFKIKIVIFISRNNFLVFIYKILYVLLFYLKKILK